MKVALHNLGCKTNSYETEAMEQALKEAGYEITAFDQQDPADIYIVNTCSVTNIADRKSRQMLHKAKKMNPKAIVVAVGCFVQGNAQKILDNEPVDICIGSNDKHKLIQALENYFSDGNKSSYVSDISKEAEFEELKINGSVSHTRAHIKIEDGCNRFCTYCIIPYARGRVRSRSLENILEEAKILADSGVKEVVLTGINMSSYGSDFNDGTDISVIINGLEDVEGIERVRLSSVEPQLITVDFLEKIKGAKKLCEHFHLSMQSGSDGVLARMNRGYTTEEFYEKCVLLRKYYNDPSLTTDIITGFPGETKKEFEETLEFIKKVGFFDIHVFQFSPREGTPAAKMEDQLSSGEKRVRSALLIGAGEEMTRCALKSFAGRQADIIVEERTVLKEGEFYTGHTRDYVKVMVPAADTAITPGDLCRVKISEPFGNGRAVKGIFFE